MYVITRHHENYDEVLLGPVEWKPSFIASVIQQDLELDFKPGLQPSDVNRIPFNIVFPNVVVRKAEVVYEHINSKIQRHEGPFWSYTEDTGTALYTAADKPIDLVKAELKAQVSSVRYTKEVSGIKYTIGETEVFISTDREKRKVYFEKLATIGDSTVQFKFGDVFISINQADLQGICSAIDSHVQSSFDWEQQKYSDIDACNTLQELDDFQIVEEVANA